MEVQIEQTGQFGRKLSVTVPADDVTKAFAAVTRELSKQVKIPGFRPGKVPKDVLEKQFASQIKSEVRERLVSDTLVSAMQDKGMAPIAAPHLHLGTLEKGGAFSYSAEFEVQPEIKLTQVKGIKVETVKAASADADVESQLEEMRKSAAQLVPVLVRDTVENGDVLLMDYEGTMGGVPFQGGQSENALIEIGGEGYLPEFSSGLMGAKVPGERVVQVDFPADYAAKELAGKPASFKIKLKEIKKKELPALDDEFAKDLGEESIAALRDKVAGAIQARKDREAEDEQRKKLLEALVLANPFDLPKSMIDEQAERMIEMAEARVSQMVGKKFNLSGQERDNLRNDSQKNAEMQVRSGLLLLEVARAEKLEVDNGDIDAEIHKMSEAMGDEAPRVEAHYRTPENRERLRYRLLEEKVIKFLLDNAERT